ncbi:MAG: lytic transglycosylase domain-containing protein [Novosphingobium sp.]|nr:lytic transglycosylase domain-containing protein [Novosphingobium sp.]
MPFAAQADVLEVNAQGFGWVAGGPQAVAAPEAEPSGALLLSENDTAPVVAAAPLSPESVTQVSLTAGPAAWRERVAQLAAKYDISPTLLEAVVWQESRWNTRAVSPVGARGLAQLMPGTARDLGVNPDDPHANLEGGARYLRMQLDTFGGNVEKALAAYNAGPGRVKQAGGIPAIRETQQYVASIMSRLSAPVRK